MTNLAVVPDPVASDEPDVTPLMTADDLAALLQVTRGHLWQMRHRGHLPPAIKLSRTDIRWDPADVTAWLNSKKEKRS